MEPMPSSRLSGTLKGWDFSSAQPNLGAPQATITVWPDRLEITSPLFRRTRTYPRDRVLRVRLLSHQHPVARLLLRVHPAASGRHYVNIVLAPEPGRVFAGYIHYVLGTRTYNMSAAWLLNLFEYYGYPVSRKPKVIKSWAYYVDLSLDRLTD